MLKNLKIVLAILSIAFCSCSTPDKKEKIKEEPIKADNLQKEIDELKKVIPETNKNPDNDEWNGNTYRNRFYKLRVEFPKDWEYDKGTTKITLARAINRDFVAVISVTVKHLPPPVTNPNNIFETQSIEEYKSVFKQFLALQNVEAKSLKIEKGTLNNFPAYIIEFRSKASSGTISEMYLAKQIQCYYDSKIYQINLNIPERLYDNNIETIFNRVIHSFNFEIVY